MLKKILYIVILIVLVICSIFILKEKKNIVVFVPEKIESEEDKLSKLIKLQLEGMTLHQKIGQMLIIGLPGTTLDPHTIEMIKSYGVGGFNLLGRNIKDFEQSKKLISDMQSVAKIPLFIATDQEGGSVIRFKFLNEITEQVKIKDEFQAESIAFERAKELTSLGVNMNFSPVLDYVTDENSYLYNRTFGTNTKMIGILGNKMIKGYMDGGVVSVVKHFPGYGNIILDPHKKDVEITIDEDELENSLLPFKEVIKENPFIPIMTAHIVIPSIDNKPATLSTKFLSEILRKEMGFKGVIITDDMEMASAGADVSESSLRAVIAGADIIISTYTSKLHTEIIDRLILAVEKGEISESRINESVERILRLKAILKQ